MSDSLPTTVPQSSSPAMSGRLRDVGAVVVSILVVGGFLAVVMALFIKAIPASSENIANILLGTLATMAGTVVNYWLGSSSGSAVKDAKR